MLKIETGTDNKILRTKSKPVQEITKKTAKFIKEMEKAMLKERGVGLAAPQVGENIRIILVSINEKKIIPMINPEIISYSDEKVLGEEGCLSLPHKWGEVKRAKEITVTFLTPKGGRMALKLKNFNARIVQHEIDHLEGVLFTDYLKKEDLIIGEMAKRREIEKI